MELLRERWGETEGWCAVGAGGAERGREAYLVGRSPAAVRGGGRWCCVHPGAAGRRAVLLRESGDAGEEGGGGVQRMDKVL
ncbi:hypothetical protein AAC387_Pa01g2373 [Persea americana]